MGNVCVNVKFLISPVGTHRVRPFFAPCTFTHKKRLAKQVDQPVQSRRIACRSLLSTYGNFVKFLISSFSCQSGKRLQGLQAAACRCPLGHIRPGRIPLRFQE